MKINIGQVHWRAFFQSLVQRGLCGAQFIVSDDHPGLGAARQAVFGWSMTTILALSAN